MDEEEIKGDIEIEDEDPLNEIFVDKNEPIDKKILVEILKPFVTIDSEGTLSFTENYDKLTNMKKALVFLLCKKAMVLKGVEEVQEPSKLKEVSEKAMISDSDAKNSLCTKYKKLVRSENGRYVILNHNLRKVKIIVLENG